MSLRLFISRLETHSELSHDDAKALSGLCEEIRKIPAGHFILREQGNHALCHVLLSGVAMHHKIGGEGKRQIVSLSFPGELLNLESLFFDKADQNIQALRESKVATFACEPLTTAMFERPNVGKALFRESLIRASVARQWMAGVGMEAAARVAHLLCELALRQECSGEHARYAYDLPVTQEQIAELIAITPQHVGRVMRTLESEDLILRGRGCIEILDWARLAARGDFSADYLHLGPV